MKVSVIGLGRLGAPFAALAAARGHTVIGVDTNPTVVYNVNACQAPVEETGLQEMMKRAEGRFMATIDLEQAIRATEMTFIIVPTPSEENGRFSLRYVLPVVEQIGHTLVSKEKAHVVVLVSTVMPGDSMGLSHILDATAGKPIPFCYNPSFIALGSVLHDLEHPDFLLIGASDERGVAYLKDFYAPIFGTPKPTLYAAALVNAEIAKLAVNAFLTTKIAFANMLGRLCDLHQGADVDRVTEIVGADSRIGSKYLKAGCPPGGPCLPRDTVALSAAVLSWLPEAVEKEHGDQVEYIADKVRQYAQNGHKVGILGLAYKVDTEVTENSTGKALLELLSSVWFTVMSYEPTIGWRQGPFRGQELVEWADVIVIATPWEEFKTLDYGNIPVIDPWRLLRDKPPKNWVPLGMGGRASVPA